MKKTAYLKPRIDEVVVSTENILAAYSRQHTGGSGMPAYKEMTDGIADYPEMNGEFGVTKAENQLVE